MFFEPLRSVTVDVYCLVTFYVRKGTFSLLYLLSFLLLRFDELQLSNANIL
jgi:hypothetical protein